MKMKANSERTFLKPSHPQNIVSRQKPQQTGQCPKQGKKNSQQYLPTNLRAIPN
jgi:hypothetical protein